MKLVILASILASAAAFAPAKQAVRTTVSVNAFEEELGAQPPLGFYDPLNIVEDADEETFDRLRYTEIKHGRISMLAVVGYLVTYAGIRIPGNIDLSGTSFKSIDSGLAALDQIPSAGIAQLIVVIGFGEAFVMKDYGEGLFPGDFRNGLIDFGWDSFDEETQLRKRGIELNQGRAAMMGILALMVHEQLGVSLLPDPIF